MFRFMQISVNVMSNSKEKPLFSLPYYSLTLLSCDEPKIEMLSITSIFPQHRKSRNVC